MNTMEFQVFHMIGNIPQMDVFEVVDNTPYLVLMTFALLFNKLAFIQGISLLISIPLYLCRFSIF